jgi:DNA-binding transcriptional MerR regulator
MNMMTVHQVSKISGVTVRTLQYYDKIGLLKPAGVSGAGYRLYDTSSLEKLEQIMLFKELEFSLKDIASIMENQEVDMDIVLKDQIKILEMKVEHLKTLISFANKLKKGDKIMGNDRDFKAFDTSKINEYKKEAKKRWGNTEEYKENMEKFENISSEAQGKVIDDFMEIFKEFGEIKNKTLGAGYTIEDVPLNEEIKNQVQKLRDYISNHFYKCSDEVLKGLGKMYGEDFKFKTNIDKVGGEGTAEFVSKAIENTCKSMIF